MSKHLLFITPGFAADEQDTACIPPLQLLVTELIRRGIGVQIISLQYPFREESYLWNGVAVFPCNGQNRLWWRWRTRLRAIAQAKKRFNQQPFDHVHSFWLGQAWLIGEAIVGHYQVGHTTTLMGQDVLRRANPYYLRQLKRVQCQRLVALTEYQVEAFYENTGYRPAAVIPWGIEKPADEENLFDQERTIDILGVGSLIPVKNWEKWLEVAALVWHENPNIRIMLIGDGPEKKKLVRLANNVGLATNLEWTGALARETVLHLMRQSKILLHTSRFESYGLVMAEAAAAGCAIISTPVGTATTYGRISTDNQQLKTLIITVLNKKNDEPAQNISTIQDTVSQYLRFWHDIGCTNISV